MRLPPTNGQTLTNLAHSHKNRHRLNSDEQLEKFERRIFLDLNVYLISDSEIKFSIGRSEEG